MKSTHMYAVQVCMHFQVICGPQVKKILVKLFKISSLFFLSRISLHLQLSGPFHIPGEYTYSIQSVSPGLEVSFERLLDKFNIKTDRMPAVLCVSPQSGHFRVALL